MGLSVEGMCNALARSSLLSNVEVKNLYQRWKVEGGKDGVADVDRFSRWLVTRQYVTEFQVGMLSRGKIDNFFLNEYKLLDRIGQGRMAGVYKAVHRLGQTVAIKVLPPSKAKDPEMFARFKREARMAGRLRHPNAVRTYQVGRSNELFYLVMEYLEGETFEDTLKRRGKLPPVEAVRVIYQVLLGLEHIHQQGMVHRDLKPSNLMLTPGWSPDKPDTTLQSHVKILDIGLGRVLFDDQAVVAEAQPQLTTDGAMLGSPIYMSPEQARSAHNVDIRSDIYTLGCVLYHALAGQPPFMDANIVKIVVKHATEQPKPLKMHNPAVPDGLQQIMNWMLAKDPNQRYPTPDRAAQALKVFLASGSDSNNPLESEPQMKAYLQWLDGQAFDEESPAGQLPPPVTPLAGQSGRRPQSTPAHPAVKADVELVPMAPGRASGDGTLDTGMGAPARRDYILLGVVFGIAGAILAGALGLLLTWWLRQKTGG